MSPGRLDRSPTPQSAPVTVRVPAKINLYLGVGGARPDGYHELATVFQAVSLYDEVTVAPAGRLVIEVQGEGADAVPRNSDNLAARAARLVAKAAGARGGVRVNLAKGIPVGGGMAGGSADGAAALVGCAEMWGVDLGSARLAAMAAELGSDVPFLLQGRTALARGRGELLAPVLSRGVYHWVLALDSEGLSTRAVYAELDRLRAAGESAHPPAQPPRPPQPSRPLRAGLVRRPGGPRDRGAGPPPVDRPATAGGGPDSVLAALRAGDAVALGRALHNDLQEPALRLRPRLARVLSAAHDLGALGVVVSGSGPTCALLARDANDATRLAAALAGLGVCRTVRRAHGPVAGARVLA